MYCLDSPENYAHGWAAAMLVHQALVELAHHSFIVSLHLVFDNGTHVSSDDTRSFTPMLSGQAEVFLVPLQKLVKPPSSANCQPFTSKHPSDGGRLMPISAQQDHVNFLLYRKGHFFFV